MSRDAGAPLPPMVYPPLVGAESAGIEIDRLLTAADVDRRDLVDGVDLGDEVYLRLWTTAAELADDPAIGLHAAEAVPYGAFDVLDYIPSHSPTVLSGLEAVVRYFRTTRAGFELQLDRNEHGATLRMLRRTKVSPALRRYSVEFTLACVVLRLSRVAEYPWSPDVVRVSHAAPGYSEEYQRIFGCSVEYQREHDELVIGASVLDLRQPHADERLRQVLERSAALIERALPVSGAVTQRLRLVLAQELGTTALRVQHVAKQMGMSARSLHRHLAGERTSFQAEVDAVRADMAARLLGDSSFSIGEVAYALGFAEVSAFSRAFRRWYDASPAAWRRCAGRPGAR